jgi:hypothetical protein
MREKPAMTTHDSEPDYVPGGPILKHKFIHPTAWKLCFVCHGKGKSLPTTCPGFKLAPAVEEAIVEGRLDYKDGFWIDPRRPVVEKVPERVASRVGTFMGVELYADTSMKAGEWKLVDRSSLPESRITS